jgi:hypothetical protein
MSSINNTVISLPGQTITDVNGNVWSIIGGQVAVNGIIDGSTSNVSEMAYENGLIWQKNSDNLWWGKAAPSDAWGPPAGTSVDPIPNQHASAAGTIVTVLAGVASGGITDASGNVWSIAGGQVTLNGVADQTTANVVELAYSGGRIYQENSAHLWWSKAKPSDDWTGGTAASPVHGVTRVWNGATAAFATPLDWSPNGVPQAGDTAKVASGAVVLAAGDAAGVNFLLQGGEVDFRAAGSYSIGTLRGPGVATLGFPTQTALVTTTGISLSGGLLSVREFASSSSTLIVHGNSTLSAGADLDVHLVGTGSLPGGPLENDGTMTVNGATLAAGTLSGQGTIVAIGNSTLSLLGASTSETIKLQSAHLSIGDGAPVSTALQFLAPITAFGATSAITLENTQATSEVFNHTSPTAGELFLYNGTTLVADLHISGQAQIYAADSAAGAPPSVTLTAFDTGHSLPITGH